MAEQTSIKKEVVELLKTAAFESIKNVHGQSYAEKWREKYNVTIGDQVLADGLFWKVLFFSDDGLTVYVSGSQGKSRAFKIDKVEKKV